MKNSGKFENSMRAVTINSEFSLPGLKYDSVLGQQVSYSRNLLLVTATMHGCTDYNMQSVKE